MHQVGPVVEHGLDRAEVVGAAAFHHIAGQRPRAAGEADQRHAPVQGAADLRHRVEYVLEAAGFGRLQGEHRFFIAQRAHEFRALAFFEMESEAHGVGHGQDVGEQDRGIERIAVERLEGDFGRQVRVLGKA
jgi:hypothetical protein